MDSQRDTNRQQITQIDTNMETKGRQKGRYAQGSLQEVTDLQTHGLGRFYFNNDSRKFHFE